jgi:2-amino-4-hydroxy-6-hydroxymethyldihydropteridine diphosphokinase
VLSLGSNVGDRLAALRSAVTGLTVDRRLRPVALSPVYETAPVGGRPQPDYLNAVLVADTDLDPHALLALTQATEAAHGRVRPAGERWGPRPLDVDIVVYGGLRHSDPVLTLPHPRAHERAFVLVPWADVDPAAELPGHGPVADLAARVGGQGVRRRDDLALAAAR